MMTRSRSDLGARAFAAAVCVAATLSSVGGCVQFPTETAAVVDHRPQVSFRTKGSTRSISSARVLVDGLDAGPVGRYLDGSAALRLTSGTHTIRVVDGDTTLLEEKVYLGDGVSRSFLLQ